MAQITADFNLGGNGNTIASGGTGSGTPWDTVSIGANGSAVYDNTHAYDALAGKFATGATSVNVYVSWSTAFGTQTDHYGRLYLYPTNFNANTPFMQTLSGGSSAGRMRINTAGKLELQDSAGTVKATSTTVLTALQFVRIEWHFIHSTTVGQLEAKIFTSPDSAVAAETVTTAANLNTLASASEIRFGYTNNATNFPNLWFDNIVAAATSYPGPASGGTTTSTSSTSSSTSTSSTSSSTSTTTSTSTSISTSSTSSSISTSSTSSSTSTTTSQSTSTSTSISTSSTSSSTSTTTSQSTSTSTSISTSSTSSSTSTTTSQSTSTSTSISTSSTSSSTSTTTSQSTSTSTSISTSSTSSSTSMTTSHSTSTSTSVSTSSTSSSTSTTTSQSTSTSISTSTSSTSSSTSTTTSQSTSTSVSTSTSSSISTTTSQSTSTSSSTSVSTSTSFSTSTTTTIIDIRYKPRPTSWDDGRVFGGQPRSHQPTIKQFPRVT